MRLQCQKTGELLQFDRTAALGAGGEGMVLPVPSDPQAVAKVYRQPTPVLAAKLTNMLANPPVDPMTAQGHVSIAWPVDLLQLPDGSRRVVGFLMPRAPGTHPLISFYNPVARRNHCPLFNYLYLHRTARNLATAVHAVHARGYVIGDLNEMNLLVTDTALLTLVDTDSFQVQDAGTGITYRCPVGRPEFTPPELQNKTFRDIDRSAEHDLFGLAVLIFQLLMEGAHPFAGIYTSAGDPPPYEARILHGHFPYGPNPGPYRVMPAAPPFDLVTPALRALFLRCFVEGRADPLARPDAETWVGALRESEDSLETCSVNKQHRFGSHLPACPWCLRAALLRGRDPFPSREAVDQGLGAAGAQTALPAAGRIAPPAIRPVSPPPAPGAMGPLGPAARATGAASLTGPLTRPLTRPLTGASTTRIHSTDSAATSVGTGRRADSDHRHREPGDSRLGHARGTGGAPAPAPGPAASSHPPESAATDPAPAPIDPAAPEVDASRALLAEVTSSIEQFKSDSLTESEAAKIRAALRDECLQARQHAEQAIHLNPQNEEAWVLRVRALRISGERSTAREVLTAALKRFPGDPPLKEQQRLLAK